MTMRWRRRRSDEDFKREIDAHLAAEAEQLVEEGLSSADAHAAAIRGFGNVTIARERFYEGGRVMWLHDVRQDLRYAARLLRRSPLFSLTAVCSLAVGLAGIAAIFSIADALFLRSLPGIAE